MRFTFPGQRKRPDDYWEIYCDAGFKYGDGKQGPAGVAIDITHGDKKYKRKFKGLRAQGPVHAELLAVYHALRVVRRLKGNRKNIIIHTDNQYVYDCLEYDLNAKKNYIVDAKTRILSLKKEFDYFEVVKATGRSDKKIKSVDRAAHKARIKEEKKIKDVKDRKRNKLEENKQRAKDECIQIVNDGGDYFALSAVDASKRYRVSLTPLDCNCPAFTTRWEKVPIPGKLRHRLPCKHLCALADHLGVDIESYIKIRG